jgi:hypothetical protein
MACHTATRSWKLRTHTTGARPVPSAPPLARRLARVVHRAPTGKYSNGGQLGRRMCVRIGRVPRLWLLAGQWADWCAAPLRRAGAPCEEPGATRRSGRGRTSAARSPTRSFYAADARSWPVSMKNDLNSQPKSAIRGTRLRRALLIAALTSEGIGAGRLAWPRSGRTARPPGHWPCW